MKTDYLRNCEDLVLEGKPISNLNELREYIASRENQIKDEILENIYKWVKDKVKDPVLSRKIRNVRLKKNLLEIIDNRIKYINNVKKGFEKTIEQAKLNLYVTKENLTIDKEKCIRCDISHTVCPKDAVKIENNEIILADTCVLCGICVPFCPTGAISLNTNEEAKEFLATPEAIPTLPDAENINGIKIKKIFDGVINVNESLCPKDCEACVSACPIGIIKRDGKKVNIQKDYCIFCNACSNACPKNAITIKRNRIFFGEGKRSAAWTSAVDKFLGKEKVNIIQNHESIVKIKGIVTEWQKNKKN